MRIKKVKIDMIHQDPANLRDHGDVNLAAIAASLKQFGQQRPILVGKNGVVVAGNGTLEAAKMLKWNHINVIETNLTGADATAYSIADNRTAELAGWTPELGAALGALQESERALAAAVGFSPEEIADLAKTAEAAAAKSKVRQPKNAIEYRIVFTAEIQREVFRQWLQALAIRYPKLKTDAEVVTQYLQDSRSKKLKWGE